MLVKHLEKLGLSSGEAKVYLALIRNGDASASDLVKRTSLGRTNIYNYANTLIDKGLVSDYERNNKTMFKADDPSALKDIIFEKKKEVGELQHEYLNLSPRLEAMYKSSTNSVQIKTYHGRQDWKEVMKMIYLENKSKNLYILYKDLDSYSPPPPVYQSNLYKNNVTTNLYTNSASTLEGFQKQDTKRQRKTIYVPKDALKIKATTYVFGDHYIYGDFEKQMFHVTSVKDKNLIFTFRALLNLLKSNYYKID